MVLVITDLPSPLSWGGGKEKAEKLMLALSSGIVSLCKEYCMRKVLKGLKYLILI